MSSTVSYDDDGRGDEAPVGSADDVVGGGGARCLRRARNVAGSGAISLSLSINEWKKGRGERRAVGVPRLCGDTYLARVHAWASQL